MRSILLTIIMSVLGTAASFPVIVTARPSIDLGDIPQRPAAPEFPFEAFFQTRRLSQIQFATDDRRIYFLRDDGQATNVFALDLTTRDMRQVTHYGESIAEFFVDPGGRHLITALDSKGNETFDLYRFDLTSAADERLTKTAVGDECSVCGLSPDGASVYYTQTRGGQESTDLWRRDLARRKASRLLRVDGQLLECEAISSDGRYLLLGELLGLSERHLGLFDLSTRKARYIMRVPGQNNVDADFSNDGVFFRSAWGSDRFRIWHYPFGSGMPRPVKLPFDNDIDALSLYGDGRVVVVRYRTKLTGRTAVFVDGFETPKTYGLPSEEILDAAFSRNERASFERMVAFFKRNM